MKTIDMIGKACPMPVVEAKKALRGSDAVQVLVDNEAAVQNLSRLAANLGAKVTVVPDGAVFQVNITDACQMPDAVEPAAPALSPNGGPTVLITADQMGRGSEELGKILIKGYIFSLTELRPRPKAVYLLNAGVRLAVQGANTVTDLKALEDQGVPVRCCGTCLNYYGLTDSLAVGQVTDMMGISTALAQADRLIAL